MRISNHDCKNQKLRGLLAWAAVAIIFISGIFIVYSQLCLPDVVGGNASPTSFSAERAFEHLKIISSMS